MNKHIYYINKNIYESYDSTQGERKENNTETEMDESISKTMLEKFKDYISKIDIELDNNTSSVNCNIIGSQSLLD